MKITNADKGPRGVNTIDGLVMLDPGQSVEVDLSEGEAKAAERTGWFEIDGKAPTKAQSHSPETEPTGLTAKHAGGGSWFVYDGDEKLGEAMTKEDAEAFNKLSDADKAALVKKG